MSLSNSDTPVQWGSLLKVISIVVSILILSGSLIAHALSTERRVSTLEANQNSMQQVNRDLTDSVNRLTVEVINLEAHLERR